MISWTPSKSILWMILLRKGKEKTTHRLGENICKAHKGLVSIIHTKSHISITGK